MSATGEDETETARYADALAALVEKALPVRPPGTVLTIPPQGASWPGQYYARLLARRVANRLGMPLVELLERHERKLHHGRRRFAWPGFVYREHGRARGRGDRRPDYHRQNNVAQSGRATGGRNTGVGIRLESGVETMATKKRKLPSLDIGGDSLDKIVLLLVSLQSASAVRAACIDKLGLTEAQADAAIEHALREDHRRRGSRSRQSPWSGDRQAY